MTNSLLVLIPPLAVLSFSLIFRKVVPALIIGICSGIGIASFLTGKSALSIAISCFSAQVELDTLCIFIFLLMLGMLIALMTTTGGSHAYAYAIQKKLRSKKSTETASLFLSLCFLIDDFFSALTVGSIMRPLTDKFAIPRAKLAFLLDAMAAPLVVLIPISSWIATLTSQFEKAGISLYISEKPLILADPFIMYLKVIPFIFYSFICIASTIFIVRARISFGPMAQQERIAKQTGNLFGGKTPLMTRIEQIEPRKGSLIDFLVPLFLLILCSLGFLLYFGDFTGFGGTRNFIQALQHSNIFFTLGLGSSCAVGASIAYSLSKQQIKPKDLPVLGKASIDIMGSAIVVLFFAWTFSTLLKNDLETGVYIAQILSTKISLLFLPITFFIVSAITSIATGSSWGTLAVITPLALPTLTTLAHTHLPTTPEQIPLLFPLLGAILAGAIAGDQISPIASTTLMSSLSAGCYHNDHVYTQFIYALPMLIASCIAFILAGFMIMSHASLLTTALTSSIIGISVCYMLLIACHYAYKNKK